MKDTTVISDSTVKKTAWRKFIDYFKYANQDKTTYKKFDFSILGGPHYSSDTEFGIGLVASGLYRQDLRDTLTPPSNLSVYADVSTIGFYLLGIRGYHIFPKEKYRINYNAYLFSFPSAFWGIGYQNAVNDDNYSIYKRIQYSVKTDFLFRISKKLFLGPTLSFDYSEGKDFNHPEYIAGMDRIVISTSVGFSFMYDTRDVFTAPYKGVYLKVEQRFFPSFSNAEDFNSTDVIFDFYQKVWKGGVLAFDFHTQINYGNVPWTMMARLGGSYRMRGYYEGRYRDNNLVEAQMELRQHVWRRNSLVLWVGAGNVFKDLDNFNFNHTLPNFGVGYRWEFKKRVNVRLDFGIGKGQTGFIFNINEAF